MAALTAARDTKRRGFDAIVPSLTALQATATTIYAGALVAVNATGFAKAAAAGDTRVIGVAEATSVNAGADGAVSVRVRRGAFKFANKAGDLVTQALVGTTCYVEDDQTVRLTAAGSIAAGRVLSVDTSGVEVEIY
jgi:predicted RecA/RadA family phage recombinase